MGTLHEKTVKELSVLLAGGEVSARDIVTDLLEAISQKDADLGAYLWTDADDMLAQADEADRSRRSGHKGALLGIPLAIKDVLNVKGQPCTCASKILQGYISPYDATAVARLRAAGAIMAGRTNMDEFAMGSSNENSAFKIVRNPADRERVPGGSSGGSAAAVAGNEAVAALGTDTGGSIRQPASFCGCVGLKPSYGRVSRYGLTAFASSLDQIGPLTKTVEDSAILLEIMSGADPMDATCLDMPVPSYASGFPESMKGLTIGLPKEYFGEGVDPEVRAVMDRCIRECESSGAEFVDVSLPHAEYAIATYYVIATAEASANLARFDGVRYGLRSNGAQDPLDMYCRTREAGFGPEVKRRIILGTYVLSSGYYDAYYVRAQKVRTLIRRDFEEAFRKCSVLMSPAVPFPAFKIGEKKSDPLQMYLCDIFTVTSNIAGVCSISVPGGLTSEKLPVGVQFIGPEFGEQVLLNAAHVFEKNAGLR